LLNQQNNFWYKCNLIFNSQNLENAFPWIINEYAGFYYLGCNGAGIFRSEDGINYYNLNNIDWIDNK